MAQLTYRRRQRLPDTAFAIPGERKYPIFDLAHARNALARVSAYGSPRERAAVQAEVYRRFPGLAARCVVRPTCRRRLLRSARLTR